MEHVELEQAAAQFKPVLDRRKHMPEPPHALAGKYPNVNRKWRWQFVSPQEHRWVNAKTGEQGRCHVHESLIRKAIVQAA